MQKLLTIAIMLLAPLVMAEAEKCKIILAGEPLKSTGYSIVVPQEATVSEQFAAEELAKYLGQMTGETLAVVPEGEAKTGHRIYVGKCAGLPVGVDWRKLGLEGIHIEQHGGDLVLAGGQRGVLYAVYSFLEENLGCRWFTQDCIVIPREGVFEIDGLKKEFVPALEYREADYPSRRPAEFSTPNKYNGPCGTDEPKWGGNVKYFGFVHTFETIVPPSVYGKDHPEYFSELKGRRVPDQHTQLCLTNPEVKKIAADYVLRAMREHPDCTIFSVSQNDWDNYCECQECTALAEQEGSQAGPLIHFVNYVADAVRDEFPDKAVDTLAYHYSRKPPKYVRPRPNVIVRLCSIECCFSHPLDTCPENKSFVEDIVGWSKLTNRLHIWDYVINYSHCLQPFPNLRVLLPNIKFFIDHGVTGIYEEGNYFSKGGELAELRSYIMAKCLWDTNTDVEKVIEEFTDAYYGAAAPMIRQYIANLHDTICDKNNTHIRIWTSASEMFDDAFLDDSEELFQQAEAAVASDPVRLHRVKVAHLGIQYAKIAMSDSRLMLEGDKLVPLVKVDKKTVDDIYATIKAEGITHVREGGPGSAESWVRSVAALINALDVKTLRNDFIAVDIVPGYGGRIWRATYLPTNRETILVDGNEKDGFIINDNGYEEYASLDYRGPGYADAYDVVESGDDFIVMRATLDNGATLTRRIEILPDKAAFKVTSRLTTDQPREGNAFRAHPAFMANAPESSVFCRMADGSWQEYSLNDEKEPLEWHEIWMNGDKRPAGQWALLDRTDNIVILNTFDNDAIDFCYLNWDGSLKRVNLEEWSRAATSDPDNGPALVNTYEVMPLDQAPWNK